MSNDPSIDQILAAIRQAHIDELAKRRGHAKAVQQALDGYKQAVEHDTLMEFARRNGVPSTSAPRADAAALSLYEAVEQLPELRTVVAEVVEAETEAAKEPEPADEPPSEERQQPLHHPALIEASAQRPLYIVGGTPVPAKLAWINDTVGVRAEWLGTQDHDGSVGKIVNRITSGSVCAVIVLNELMGHAQTVPIAQAARRSGVPHFLGRKGGQAQLLTVLDQIEQRLNLTRLTQPD